MPKILIIESDSKLGPQLATDFEAAAYDASLSPDQIDVERYFETSLPDLVLVDWLSSGGPEAYTRLRAREELRRLPFILLDAPATIVPSMDEPGLVLERPVPAADLIAAARSLLRRMQPPGSDSLIVVREFELDRERHRLRRSGKYIHLGPLEFRLMEFFMLHPGQVLTRQEIIESVWGKRVTAGAEERVVDVQLRRLRAAINHGGKRKDPIKTVRGQGYAFS